jgi:hypothetical protein
MQTDEDTSYSSLRDHFTAWHDIHKSQMTGSPAVSPGCLQRRGEVAGLTCIQILHDPSLCTNLGRQAHSSRLELFTSLVPSTRENDEVHDLCKNPITQGVFLSKYNIICHLPAFRAPVTAEDREWLAPPLRHERSLFKTKYCTEYIITCMLMVYHNTPCLDPLE